MLLGLLPLLFVAATYFALVTPRRPAEPFLKALLVWGAAVFVLTELQSLTGALTRAGSAAGWAVLIFSAGAWAAWRHTRTGGILLTGLAGPFQRHPVVTAVALSLLALTLATALLAPPNGWDAMTYHLPRVMHWIQNGSAEPYRTSNPRQGFMPPLPSYAVLQLYLLAGGDRFVNLVQWLAGAGSVVGVGLIARQLGAGRRGAALAVLVAVTLPMGLLYLSGAYTDWVASLWAVQAVYFGLLGVRRGGWRPFLWQALALGLLAVTKPTGVYFATPFLVWQAAVMLRRTPKPALARLAVAGAVVAAFVAAPAARAVHVLRTTRAEVPHGLHRQFGPAILASDLVRNATLHLGSTERINRTVESAVTRAHERFGLDVNYPMPYVVREFVTHEDEMGNPLHLLLALGAVGLTVGSQRLRRRPRPLPFALCLSAGAVVFCTALAWSPYRQHLHMPWFVLSAPLVGAVFARQLSRFGGAALGTALVLFALPFALANAQRPLLAVGPFAWRPPVWQTDRYVQYFTCRPRQEESFTAAARAIAESGVRTVGLSSGHETLEYYLWVALRHAGAEVRVVHLIGDEEDSPPPGVEARVFLSNEPQQMCVTEGRMQWEYVTVVFDDGPRPAGN